MLGEGGQANSDSSFAPRVYGRHTDDTRSFSVVSPETTLHEVKYETSTAVMDRNDS